MVSIFRKYPFPEGFRTGIAIFLCLVLLISGCARSVPPVAAPTAEDGRLDARGYDFESAASLLSLNGRWDVYWQRLLTPGELAVKAGEPSVRVELPQAWHGAPEGEPPGSGYATYRLRLLTDEGHPPLALKMPMIRTAYRLWISGELAASVGVVAASAEAAVPKYEPRLVPLDDDADEYDIVLQVSNYSHRLGGVWTPLLLGSTERVEQQARRALSFNLIAIGSLLAMGIHHLGLVVLRRQELSSLYFSVFCLLLGIRALFIGEAAIYAFRRDFPWSLAIHIEYACFFLALPAAALFVRSVFPMETPRWLAVFPTAAGLCFTALLALLPAPYFTWEAVAYQVVITVAGGALLLLSAARRFAGGRAPGLRCSAPRCT